LPTAVTRAAPASSTGRPTAECDSMPSFRCRFGIGLLEAQPGFEPGMEVLQTSALPLGYCAACEVLKTVGRAQEGKSGAGNGIRTRDFDLGKVALYH
jgi:hypothetical protein